MIPRFMRLVRAHFAPLGPEKRFASTHFSLSVRETKDHGGCAAIVSKKVAKLAVSRHQLKRRMLTVMRPWCKPQYALMVYARPGSPDLEFSELQTELSELLHRALSNIR